MTLRELIINYRKQADLSQRQFAQRCGISNGYISMIEKGENPNTKQPLTPTLPLLNKIASGMNLTLTELMTAVDDMPVSLESSLPSNILPLPQTRLVPMLGAIACGEPILAEQNIEAYVNVNADIPADFALKCKGDSMINARIFDGDIVYIRRQADVDDGEIAAVLIDTEATLKRVRKLPNKLILSPCNPMYDDLIYTAEQLDSVRILGKAVAFTSTIR